jgi:hypothetical protein
MNPRLKTSKKWTAFPKEYVTQIEEVFAANFKKNLQNATLVVEGRIFSEEVLLRVGIKEKNRLSQANFEVSMNYSSQTKDAVERIHDCIDAAASMMNEFFEAQGEIDFPRSWQEYEFNKRPVFLQFSTVNSDLEAQADALLGQSSEDMVREDKESEDALDAADEKIESEEPPSPTMLGGAKKKKKTDLH